MFQLQVLSGTMLDFETAESHIVEVEVRDAGGDFLEMMEFTIAVADVNEAPDFDLPVTTLNELSPNGTVVGTLDLVEDAADIDPPTVTLMDDAGGRFELVLVAGEYQLRVANGAALNFENMASHQVTVKVDDGVFAPTIKTFTINLADVNEAPTGVALLDGSMMVVDTVAEDAIPGTTVIGTLHQDGDPDAGNTHTFTLLDDAGGRFQIVQVGADFELRVAGALDFETATSHDIIVQVSDGAFFAQETLTINVTDANDDPLIGAGLGDDAEATVAETNAALMTSGTLTVSDEDVAMMDIVTVSVLSVTTSGNDMDAATPGNPSLLAMLTVAPVMIPAGPPDANNLTWTFNSNPTIFIDEAFDYLAVSESLVLEYVVEAKDNAGATAMQMVTIQITGTNDVPTVSGPVLETRSEDFGMFSVNLLDGANDVDTSDVLNVTGLILMSGDDVGITVSVDGNSLEVDSNAYTGLAADESEVITYSYVIDDGNGGTVAQIATITITGENDAPVISVEVTDSAEQTLPETNAGLMATGTLTVTDVDVTDVVTAKVLLFDVTGTTVGAPGMLGDMLTVTPVDPDPILDGMEVTDTLSWTFDSAGATFDYLADGESLVLEYTVEAKDDNLPTPGTDTQTVTITITGTNDAPVIAATAPEDITGSVMEIADGAAGENVDTHSVMGSFDFSDLDLTDTHMVTVAPVGGGAGFRGILTAMVVDAVPGDGAARVDWTFDVSDLDLDDLAEGQVVIQAYDLIIDDDNGGLATETVTITITGMNDAPVITVEMGDNDTETLPETDSALMATGTLTVTDVDTTDTVMASVVEVITAGDDTDPPAPDNATLLAMLTLDPLAIIGNTETTNPLNWSFNSSPEVFNYLAEGDSLELYYTVEVLDDNGASDTHTVMIEITGTNDAPEITLTGSDSAAETLLETDASLMVSGSLTVTDADVTDVVTASVPTVVESGDVIGAPSNAALLLMLTVLPTAILDTTETTDTLGWTFASGLEAFDYLADGESLILTYDVKVEDDNTMPGSFIQKVTITIDGTNDGPVINVGASTLAGAVMEIADGDTGENTIIHMETGSVAFEDLDLSDTHTSSFLPQGGGGRLPWHVLRWTADNDQRNDHGHRGLDLHHRRCRHRRPSGRPGVDAVLRRDRCRHVRLRHRHRRDHHHRHKRRANGDGRRIGHGERGRRNLRRQLARRRGRRRRHRRAQRRHPD